MIVPVMHVREVRVGVLDRVVYMDVGMGFLPTPAAVVLMLVVCIVDMGVFVFQGRMTVPMCVGFGEMQPYARSHEESGDCQSAGQRRTQGHREGRTDERSQRKVGAGTRSSEIAQRYDEQRQTQPVTHKAQ